MADFQTFDLGRVLQTAEAIKGMRRQEATSKLQDAYLGVQTRNAEQAGQIAGQQEQRAQGDYETQTDAREALRQYHIAQAVESSPDPLTAVRQLAPEFEQHYDQAHGAGSFGALTADQLKVAASHIRERAGAIAGVQPKYGKPETGQVDGKDVFFQIDESNPNAAARVLPGVQPRPQKTGKGISMTMPDGTEVQIGGDGSPNYGGVPLTKPNQTKLQEAFINSQGNAYALREQLAKYRPEFSTLGGQFKAGMADLKGKIGLDNAPQQKQFLTDFTSWKADTASLLSQYLNQLSGAAISPAEETRLKAGFPNPEDGPDVYQAKAASTLRRFALVQARAAYLLSNPAQEMTSVSLDKMGDIVATEANKLAESFKRGGMDAQAAKAKAIAATRQRFGMDDAQ